MEKKLDFLTVMKEGLVYGTKNVPSLLGALILWILTILIPYVNVGTTIAISTLPLQLSRGTIFSPLNIFDKKYYRYAGEYFLTRGFISLGTLGAMVFMLIPAIVISISWSLAVLLVLDKGVNAAEALRLSNKLTYGNKWTMFFVSLASYVAYIIVLLIFIGIVRVVPVIGILLILASIPVFYTYLLGCQASIYGTLSRDIDEQH
ncbi:MAG: hypothetical protein LBK07_10180 [Tannerella sp.]|jgi:uncharacterized membrane protein|nr:hypothetical protein [Tannerella sp.]